MHIFSFVLIAVTILNLCLSKSKKSIIINQTALLIFICSFVGVGHFLDSNLINIDYYQVAIVLEAILLVVLTKTRVTLSKSFLLYLGSLFTSIIVLLIFPSTTANVTGLSNPRFENYMTGHYLFSRPEFSKFSVFYLVLAMCLAFIVNTLRSTFSWDDWRKELCILSKLGKAYMLLVCFEFIIKYMLGSNLYANFIVGVFGRGSSAYLTLENRGFFVMMQGLTREGSHFVYAMMLMTVLFYSESVIEKRNNNKWIVMSIAALILSGALMMLVCIMTLSGYYLLVVLAYGKSKTRKRITICIITIAMIVFIAILAGYGLWKSNGYIGTRLADAMNVLLGIGSKNVSYYANLSHVTSNQTRIFSLVYTLEEWIKRPLFGVGLGTTYAYSTTLLTLAEVGVITLFALFYSYYCLLQKYSVTRKIGTTVIALWAVCNVFAGVQSRLIVAPDVLIILGCCIVLFGGQRKDTVAIMD